MNTLLVATTNRHKVDEIRQILAGLPFGLATLADYATIAPLAETGATFAANARAKALYYAAATGALTVAEDSGLEIDALGGRPGVESARFGGTATPYPGKFALIYDALRSVPSADRSARFVCALALAREGTILFEARGVVEGLIAPQPKGAGGFGYDPIFFYPPAGVTLAEIGPEKMTVSHRAEAFRRFRTFLSTWSG